MRVKVACCTALLLGLLVSPAMAAIIVRIQPTHQDVPLDADPVYASIVADIPANEAIIGWGLDLTLIGSSVGLTGFTIPLPWDPAQQTPDGDLLAGLVQPPQTISGTGVVLADLTFSKIQVGLTTLHLSVTPGDLTEGLWGEGGPLAVQYVDGEIMVPEPTALTLLALGGLALLRRR